jgi:hypothetical protein
MCWRPQTNGYSYLRVTAIWIDVHPARETQPTCHTHPMLCPHMISDHMYLTRSMHSNLSHSLQQIWTDPLLPRRRVPDPTPSTCPQIRTQVLSHTTQWSSGENTSFCWQPATMLIGPISPACSRYVQYLLTRANPSVLNWHKPRL